MTKFEYGQDGKGEQPSIPEGVLKGIEDIVEGRTLSDEEFDDVLDF